MRTSTLAAVTFAVALTACSQSTAPISTTSALNSPTLVVTTATSTVPAATTATSTHTPVWITVKYRTGSVDVADPRFAQLDGRSSSLVDAAFYDPGNSYMIVSLNGTAYHYCGMPNNVWSSFAAASSLGSFFNAEIKGNFDCRTGFVPEY